MNIPLYIQVKQKITQELMSGNWRAGDLIPSEIELAQSYQVSQGTVRKAIDELSIEKILIRRQGKGTYVTTHNEEQIQLRFLRLTSTKGNKEKLESQLLSFEKTRVNSYVANRLNLRPGSSVYKIKRVLTFARKPLILDEIYISTIPFKGLNAEMINQKKGSLYRLYESNYGIQMLNADEKIKAVSAEAEVSKLLNIKKGHPILGIERVSYTYGNKPIEWRLGLCLTDEYHYQTELE
jgi:GntR family transcriptional regulator